LLAIGVASLLPLQDAIDVGGGATEMAVMEEMPMRFLVFAIVGSLNTNVPVSTKPGQLQSEAC
jgi:hypothetical protein